MVTITPSLRETTYAPVSPTTDFPVGFPIFGRNIGEFPATDLEVVVNDVVRTDFSVIATFSEGVSTNAVVRMATGVTGSMIIRGKRTPRRTDQYANGAPLPISAHNYSLNRLEAEMQEVRRDTDAGQLGFAEEVAARIAGDTYLNDRVDTEVIDRKNGDLALASLIGQGGPIEVPLYDTRLAVSLANIKPTINAIHTGGFTTVGDGGGAMYKRVSAEPSHAGKVQSADGGWWELFGHSVDPKSLGALGAGDVTEAMNDAMKTAFALGVPVRVSSGDYYIHGSITNPGVKVLGIGAGLANYRKVGVGNIFRNDYTLPVRQGYYTAAVPVNSRSVTLQNLAHAANFSAGQFAILGSQTRWITNDPQRMGEFVKIRKVEGAVVTFWGPTKEAYLLSDQPELVPVTLMEGLEYRGFTSWMDNTVPVAPGTISDADIRVIDTCFAHAPQFAGIEMHDANSAGIALEGCLGARVINCSGFDFGSSTDDSTGLSSIGNGGFGYVVSERGLNEDLVVDNLYAERCRHAYTTGASYILNIGRPMNSLIVNCTHRDSKEAGFDTHGTGVGICFVNCRTIGSGRTGMQIRSHRTRIKSFYAKNCFGCGLWLIGSGVSPNKGDDCEVDGVYLENTNFGFGESYDGSADWRESPAIRDQGINNRIKSARVDGCGGPFYGTNSASQNNTLEGAIFRNGRTLASAAGPAITLSQTGADRPKIRNVSIDGTNGRIVDLVRYVQNSASCVPTLENVSGDGHTGLLFTSAFANNQQVNVVGEGYGGYRETISLATGIDTFSVRGRIGSRFNLNPAAVGGYLRSITDATEGQRLLIYGGSNALNVEHGTTTDRIFLKGGATVVLTANQSIEIERRGTLWYEI